jgi:hypothetical protein
MADVPAGTVMPFVGTPQRRAALQGSGWLPCTGGTFSADAYPKLRAAIGTTYGDAGAQNVVVPDMRGTFLRGVDGGAGRDPDLGSRGGGEGGNGVGSRQPGMLAAHQHFWDWHFYQVGWSGDGVSPHQPPGSPNLQNNSGPTTNVDGGGPETAPKNVAVFFMIATG